MADLPKTNFKISAAVVRQLGEELVSDELTAIMELVKNSYDADADWVKITIETREPLNDPQLKYKGKKGYIVIEDNGHGMDIGHIVDRWLFISVSHKREMKRQNSVTDKGRTPLGDKGLGRLSTQRLGNILEMFSGIDKKDKMHHVSFDWKDFKERDALESVNVNYEELDKPSEKKGTKLIISELKSSEVWLNEGADKFRGQLSKLIFPFKEKRPFSIYLTINGQKNDLDLINEKLRNQAISRYSFGFNGKHLTLSGTLKFSKLQGNSNDKRETYNQLVLSDKGKNFFQYLTNIKENKKYALPNVQYSGEDGVFFSFTRKFEFGKDFGTALVVSSEGKSEPANPGQYEAEIDEFNLSGTEEVEAAYDKLSEYKQLVKNQVGVRIFRDGFGIKPYGMEDNDWLKLSKSQTSGGSFYLLRPENVIGYVAITAKDNKFLIEKTDREGFIDNEFSKNFFNSIKIAVSTINDVLDRTRRSYDEFKKKVAAEKGNITSFTDAKNHLVEAAKQSKDIETEAQSVHAEIKSTAKKVTEAVDKIKNEPLFSDDSEKKALKILEEVEKILSDSNKLLEKVHSLLQNTKILEHDANYLEPKINELEKQIIEFSELAGLGITAEAFTHEVYNIIDRISSQTQQIQDHLKKQKAGDASVSIYIENVKTFVTTIRSQLNHLAPSLKFNKETKQNITLSKFAEELKSYYNSRFSNLITLKIVLSDDFSIQANKGKITQVVDNIILNSEYWLKVIKKEKKDFEAEISITIKKPFINISDNGYGILPDIEQTLFQPFVTTKPSGEGRGLGLFVVQQLMDSLDSNVILLNERNSHDRRYIFQLNFESVIK